MTSKKSGKKGDKKRQDAHVRAYKAERRKQSTKYRAVILLLASSGIRKGGLKLLWKDFTSICHDGDSLKESNDGDPACVAVRVYRGSKEEYTTFVTPEAWEAIQEWRVVWASVP